MLTVDSMVPQYEEVKVEAVWEVLEEEEEEEAVEAEELLDPLTLGVPGLKTLILGDRVEVLWRHGASSLPMLALQQHLTSSHTAPARRLGEGASEGVRARDAGRPARYHLPHHV